MVSTVVLAARVNIAALYRVATLPGAVGLRKLYSVAVTNGKTRLTIMDGAAGLSRLNNAKGQNGLPRTIRLAKHPGKAGQAH